MTPMCTCGASVSRVGRLCRRCGHDAAWAKRFASAEGRFWAKVDRHGPDECWPWMGGRSPQGYGHARFEGRQIAASRLALQYTLGRPVAPGMEACHRCDNPPCCNPAHLFEGSSLDNNRDKVAKGRARGPRPGFRHLSGRERIEIAEARLAGVATAVLAGRYGVSTETIRRVALDRQPDGTYTRRRTFAARDETGWTRAA